MAKLAAIVEGHTEEHFIRSTCSDALVLRCIPNGRDVSLDVIVDVIAHFLETLSGEYSRVLILFDREQRAVSSQAIAQIVEGKLADLCGERKLYIGVADRQIENWIIADVEEMRRQFDPTFEYEGDGCHGKATLTRLCGGVSRGPRDKARMLRQCSANRASQKSPSLNGLIESVDFAWDWATR